MNEKQTKLYNFYKKCEEKGYRNMLDETESLKAKVIATDLGIKYKDIAKTYEEAKNTYEEEIRRVEHEKWLQATDGEFLLELIGSGRDDTISVYRREDGSLYNTHKKESHKYEGAPALNLKSGGTLLYTYHPSQAVYTGASSGGIHMGGVHHTEAYMDEKVSNSGKGYIDAVSGDYSMTVKKIQLSDFLIGKFKRDDWYNAHASKSGLIYCYSAMERSNNSFLVETAMAQTDYYKRMSMLSMAADRERLSMKDCKERINFLNNALSGNYPASDEDLYLRAVSLEGSDTSAQLKESIDLFKKLSDYKDSKARAEKLLPKYEEVLQHEKEQAILKKEAQAAERQVQLNKLKKAAPYLIAALVVLIIAGKFISGRMELKSTYEEAMTLLEEHHFDDAKQTFIELGDYKDSAEMVYEVDYQRALNYIEGEAYPAAIGMFTELGDYSDSKAKIDECYDIWIAKAEAYYEKEQYYNAIDCLEAIIDFTTRTDVKQECTKMLKEITGVAEEIEKQEDIAEALKDGDVKFFVEMAEAGELETMTGEEIQEIIVGFWSVRSESSPKVVSRYEYLEDGTVISYQSATDTEGLKFEYSVVDDYLVYDGANFVMYKIDDYYYLKVIVEGYTGAQLMRKPTEETEAAEEVEAIGVIE